MYLSVCLTVNLHAYLPIYWPVGRYSNAVTCIFDYHSTFTTVQTLTSSLIHLRHVHLHTITFMFIPFTVSSFATMVQAVLEGALLEARAGRIQVARKFLQYLIQHVPW